jgi:hypothetical protein
MRNAVLIGILVFASAGLTVAQSASSSPDAQTPANLPWDMSALTGCLTQKMGTYLLTDAEGTAHELLGSYGKLRHEVDHQIEVIGKTRIKTVDGTLAGGASTVVEKRAFEVKSVKHIADKCSAAGE